MKVLARNQLVWIEPAAWAQIEARDWDAQAQEILAHWRTRRLPLVVCRQSAEAESDQVCVGLPAPQSWAKRRLALTVSLKQITACENFPTLLQLAQAYPWNAVAVDVSRSLASLGAQAHVYGSYGWQWLTGLAYVHGASDLDLSVNVSSFEMASQVVTQLDSTAFHCRLDGEIVFPQGQAIAWREMHQLLQGQTSQVLVKDRFTLQLATLEEVLRWGTRTTLSEPVTVLVVPDVVGYPL